MVWGRVVKAANTPCHPLPPSGAPLAGAGAVPPGALVPPCIWWRLFNCQCIVYILGCCHSSTQQQPLDTKNGRHQEGIQTSWRTRHLELVGMGQSVHGHGGVGSLSPEAPSARKLSYSTWLGLVDAGGAPMATYQMGPRTLAYAAFRVGWDGAIGAWAWRSRESLA